MQVSIILPYYNAEPWIGDTIRSIQAQTMHDWELICVNDFSEDESEEIVREIANTDHRIKLRENKSKGIIPALQLALENAQGNFITRMDADDLMTPHRLELMVNLLQTKPEKTVVTAKVRYFSEGILSEGFKRYEEWINNRVKNLDHNEHLYRECTIASPNWMTYRQALVVNNLFNQLRYPEDYDLVFRWYELGFDIACLNEVTLLWRDHATRTSKTSKTYNQKALFKLKLGWFNRLHGNEKSIGVLGAGTKGKITTGILSQTNVDFNWYDFNFEKYKGKQGSIEIKDYSLVHEEVLLVTIYPSNLDDLESFLDSKGYIIGKNAWYL